MDTQAPFFVSIPHAGEYVPPEAEWLKNIPENILMCDVDRYINLLYAPIIEKLNIPAITARIHRYVVDVNRSSQDIDERTVVDAGKISSVIPGGFHWLETTREHVLMYAPISQELHASLTEAYYNPFHLLIKSAFERFERLGYAHVYHLDLHSMPSKGEKVHRDAGAARSDVVVSDFHGTSCDPTFKDAVIDAYRIEGFSVGYNWPYEGGHITKRHGVVEMGHHTAQVELNRALYMDEETRQMDAEKFFDTQKRVYAAVKYVYKWIERRGF